MATNFEKAVVLGATGATGLHLSELLLYEGVSVRVVSRSESNLARAFPAQPFERRPADLLDSEETRHVIEGCDLAFDCVGLPGDQMALHGRIARNIADAVQATSARCVQVSSYWAYMPLVSAVLNENHPRTDGSPWMKYRREAEDVLQQAGAAILHLPDFYGPHVRTSTLQLPLADAGAGKAMNWVGPADLPREYAFVPDAMRIAVQVARRPGAYGERWVLPGGGRVTAREVAEIAGRHLGRAVKTRAAGPLLLRLVSLFNPELRGFLQMVPEYMKPIAYDAAKLEALVGKPALTPYASAIPRTLDWLRSAQIR